MVGALNLLDKVLHLVRKPMQCQATGNIRLSENTEINRNAYVYKLMSSKLQLAITNLLDKHSTC